MGRKPGHRKRKQGTQGGKGPSGGGRVGLGPHAILGKGPFLPPGSDSPQLTGPARETLADTAPLLHSLGQRQAVSTEPRIQAQSPLLPQDTHPWAGTRRWGGRGSKRHIFLPVGDKVLRTGPGHTADAQWMSAPVAVITKPGSSAASGVLPGCAVSTLSRPRPWPSLQGLDI